MDIKLTEEQTQLQDSASKFMDKHCTFEFVRRMEKESKLGFCPEMWRQFAEMGWLGMIIPEEFGGMGMSLLDTVVLIREMGRHICPSPFLFTSVLAAVLIEIVPDDSTRPAIARSSDDLPAPFGPITPSHSPDSTRSLKGSSTVRLP